MKKLIIILIVLVIIGGLVFGGLLFMGCTNIHFHDKAKDGQIKVACVGDSITYGMLVTNVFSNSYPARLSEKLGEEYHVLNFGFSGKTAQDNNKDSYRKTNKYKLSIEYQPDVVVIMLGSNDTKAYNWSTREKFKADYKELISVYLNLESKPRVIIGTPNSGFYVGKKSTGAYNYDIDGEKLAIVTEVVKELAVELDVEIFDTYELTKAHPEWYKLDGIHPNKDGANAMAEVVASVIKK